MAPLLTLAATAPKDLFTQPSQVVEFFCGALVWMFWGLIVLSVAMALVAGYRYVTSSGEPEKVSTAGKTLLYAAIGIAVALLAKGFPSLVGSFFNTSVGVCESAPVTITYPTGN